MKWWPKLRRKLVSATAGSEHVWTHGDGPTRCKRCYQQAGLHDKRCAGRPEIVIDVSMEGRAGM